MAAPETAGGLRRAARALWAGVVASDPDPFAADAARRGLEATSPAASAGGPAGLPIAGNSMARGVSSIRYTLACDERTGAPAGPIKLLVLEVAGRPRVLLASAKVDERWGTAEESLGVTDPAFAESLQPWLDRSLAETCEPKLQVLWPLHEPFDER